MTPAPDRRGPAARPPASGGATAPSRLSRWRRSKRTAPRYVVVPDATMGKVNAQGQQGGIPCTLVLDVPPEFWARYAAALRADHVAHWGAP